MPDWLTFLLKEWAVVAPGPVTFVAVVILLGMAIWFAAKFTYSERLTRKDELIATKDIQIALQERQIAEYKDKLQGASPNEARAMIDGLQVEIEKLRPSRRLVGSKREQFMRKLRSSDSTAVSICLSHDNSCADCSQYAMDIYAAIKIATRWQVTYESVQQSPFPVACGLKIVVRNPLNLPEEAALLLMAFRELWIAVEVAGGIPYGGHVFELSVSEKYA